MRETLLKAGKSPSDPEVLELDAKIARAQKLLTELGASTDSTADNEDTRGQMSAMIYAEIRMRMEDAIQKRAELLKAGTDPSDPEVRALEGVIVKARALLLEVGEVVDPVDPPIVGP